MSAIIFNDLKNGRIKDIKFDEKAMLSMDGETGPYVQYAAARLASILRKAGVDVGTDIDYSLLEDAEEVLLTMAEFGPVLSRAVDKNEPSTLTTLMIKTASSIHSYLRDHHVLSADAPTKAARLALVTRSQATPGRRAGYPRSVFSRRDVSSDMDINEYIRDVPDFPKPGIVFKDITPLLANTNALHHTIDTMKAAIEPLGVDKIAGIESRGFLFGVPVARDLGVGFIPIRKPEEAALADTLDRIRARVRIGHDRDPRGRGRGRRACRDHRRSAGNRRHHGGFRPAHRSPGWSGRRVQRRDRARLPVRT